jgi:hypothetical protein
MTEARCRAAEAASRAYTEISRRDVDDISLFAAALADFSSRSSAVIDRLRSAKAVVFARVAELQRRIGFHVRVALGGVRRTFDAGFAAAFDELRERSLVPLYETINDLDMTIEQLKFMSTSDTMAREVRR